jgi:formylglycine-generating enzyme
MKKDALYWGIVAAFASFLLLIFWTAYDAWKISREKRLIAEIETPEEASRIRIRDYSDLQTLEADDGKTMVLIPEGPFGMGSHEGEGDLDEFPYHISFLSSYYIDMHEMTFDEYSKFIKATGAREPGIPVFQDDLSLITAPHQPVVGISWAQAADYCKWAGKRLPTEAEWEKAARGAGEWTWPWGNTFESAVANTGQGEDGYQYSAPPGRFEAGRSPYGLYDMAGNAAEWVQDVYDPNYYELASFRNPKGPEAGKHRVYRGGSWNDSLANVRTAKRFAAAAHQASAVIGFRCAADVLKEVEIVEDKE